MLKVAVVAIVRCIYDERGQPQNKISKINTLFFLVEKQNLSFCHLKTLLQFCQRGPLSKMQASRHSRRSHHRSDCDNDLKSRRCSSVKDETLAEGTAIITAAAVAMALRSSDRNKRQQKDGVSGRKKVCLMISFGSSCEAI